MFYLVLKTLLSAGLIVIIAETSKRSIFLGSIFASIPFVSVIAMLWLYHDTKNLNEVSALSKNIFWMVIPSLVFFISFPILVRHKFNFYIAMGSSIVLMLMAYFSMIVLLKKLGVDL